MGIQQQIWSATRRAARWHVHSQEIARRNAMVASTTLTQRRRETDEVEEFLALHRRQYDARAGLAAERTPQRPALRSHSA